MKSDKQHLDQEEKEILTAFEADELSSVPNVSSEKNRIRKIVKTNANKNRRVSLRMTEWDFLRIQEEALREGLAYQSLLSSVIHKYLTGRLVDKKTEVR